MFEFDRLLADFNACVNVLAGLTLSLASVAICYLKCRVATNISHWLKVQSRWFKNFIICVKVYFDQLLYCFYYSFTLYYCAIFYSLDAGFIQYHRGVKQFGSRLGPTFCWA